MEFSQYDLDLIARARETAGKSLSQAWEDGDGPMYSECVLMARMFEAMTQKKMVETNYMHRCRICERAEGPCLFAGAGQKGRVFRCGEFELARRHRQHLDKVKGRRGDA